MAAKTAACPVSPGIAWSVVPDWQTVPGAAKLPSTEEESRTEGISAGSGVPPAEVLGSDADRSGIQGYPVSWLRFRNSNVLSIAGYLGATDLTQSTDEVLKLLSEQGPRLYALLYRLTLDHDAADDLMQELFLNLTGRQGFATANDPVGYAIRSATHLAFDWRRKKLQSPSIATLTSDVALPSSLQISTLVQQEEMQQVLSAMEELSERDRSLLVLRYLESQSYEQIAAALEKTPHQTRALCYKALLRLRRRLGSSESNVLEGGPRDEA